MRIAFIGCVDFSLFLLEHVLSLPDAEVVGVVTRRESAFHGDFASLGPLAAVRGVACYYDEKNRQTDMAEWLRQVRPDVVYCFGWPYLLKAEILGIPPLGVVGYHPAALPRNRGRHPIIWTLVLGLPETCSTFFIMDEGADSGDIVSQRTVPVSTDDDAASLYHKLKIIAKEQVGKITVGLASGTCARRPQDHSLANYWRKRTKMDGEIDWRMSARSVCNLVRALARPYPGAHCTVGAHEVKIWRARIAPVAADAIANLEPGKVLGSDPAGIRVKCGDGAVDLLAHEFESMPLAGEYLL